MKYHRTKDGEEILIAQMDDKHLLNTINFFLKKLEAAKCIVDGNESKFSQLVNGIAYDEDSATRYIDHFNDTFGHYILEAIIRSLDIEDSIECYIALIGRRAALAKNVLLIDKNIVDDDDYAW